ncbi:FGGY-family carbohydrate kinase [Pseudonocardia sichuanensis]
MTGPLLVGLDVGTTSSKAVVVTADGREVARGRSHTPWVHTGDGVELDAVELAAAARSAVEQALAAAPPGPVAGLGVASMAESGVLLDRHGRPAAPVIAWHDRRDRVEVDELAAEIGGERFSAVTGLPLWGQWSLTKQRWLHRHRPTSAAAAVRRLNVAEWIVRDLGGDEGAEPSLASRTGWLQLASRTWWPETLGFSGITESLLPPLHAGGESWGRVRADEPVGRLAGATLTVAGHDHQSAAIGVGAAGIGDELDSCGTAEALVRTVAPGLPADAVAALTAGGITVGWHVLPDRWCLLGGTEGGLTLSRVLAMLGLDSGALAELDPRATALADTPVEVATDDRGVVLRGIGDGVGPAQVWRAALERITAEAGVLHELMSRAAGPVAGLVAAGGWARSEALVAVKERVLGPVARPPVTEAGARGAALLAGLAAGVLTDLDELPPPAESLL